jgi:hypothetical protein
VTRTAGSDAGGTPPFRVNTMDLSKLPRLSRSTTPPGDPNAGGGRADTDPVGYQPPARYRAYDDRYDGDGDGALNFLDIFLAVGMGCCSCSSA